MDLQMNQHNAQSIGFIGTGHQGAPMAHNIARAGHQLVVYDTNGDRLAPFVAIGATIAGSLEETARLSDIVGVCVLTEKQVTDVSNALLEHMRPRQCLVLHSTVSPAVAVALGEAATARGVLFLDAPVSGASMRAREEGSLTVFAGGTQEAFEAASPLLEAVGSTIALVGPAGAGQAGKLCNNLMLFCNTLASLEAARLADAYGISEERMVELVGASSGASWSLSEWGYLDRMRTEHSLANDEEALLSFLEKDLLLVNAAATDKSVALPMGARAAEVVRSAIKKRWETVKSRRKE